LAELNGIAVSEELELSEEAWSGREIAMLQTQELEKVP
jgi:hypothetical protein